MRVPLAAPSSLPARLAGRAHQGKIKLEPALNHMEGINDARQQHGKPPVGIVQLLNDPVHGFRVVILQPPPGGVREQFPGQTTVKFPAMFGGQELLQLLDILK